MRRLQTIAGVAALALTASMAAVPQAEAAGRQRTLASGLISPLSLAVARNGTTYVTENFAGILAKVWPGRSPRVLYRSQNGNEVGGVSVRHGRVVFTETASDAEGNPAATWVKVLRRNGTARTLAHVRAYENRKNPDHRTTYGARGISSSCASQWPAEFGPAVYRGLKDSHPYATWQTRNRTYVADAGMNAVLSIARHGKIRTVAVLPPTRVKITSDFTQMGIPACAVGLTYYGEPVPTDVERARDGSLYVTTEGGGLGEQMPLGALYRIRGRHVHKVTGKLFGAVGVAVNRRGNVFVSELFGGRISKVRHGTHRARTFAKVNMPGALDWSRGHLYATTDVLVGAPDPSAPPAAPGGKVVRFRH